MTNKTPTETIQIISIEEMRVHMARVETLCDIVEALIQGMASHPLFSAMIPPEIRNKFSGS